MLTCFTLSFKKLQRENDDDLLHCAGNEHSQVRVGWRGGKLGRRDSDDTKSNGNCHRMYWRHHVRSAHHARTHRCQVDGRLLQPGQSR